MTHPIYRIESTVLFAFYELPMTDKIKLRNLIANAEIEDSDNLAIIIATYYDDHPRCPSEPDDTETGWKPWVMEQTDRILDAAVANILEANSQDIPSVGSE